MQSTRDTGMTQRSKMVGLQSISCAANHQPTLQADLCILPGALSASLRVGAHTVNVSNYERTVALLLPLSIRLLIQ